LSALVLLRKPLFGPPKRRKQPERYAQYQVKKIEKYIDKKDTAIVKYNKRNME
jgi:hypothetical protein